MTIHFFRKQFFLKKTLSSEKVNTNEDITLTENNNTMLSEIEIAEKLDAVFSNIIIFI